MKKKLVQYDTEIIKRYLNGESSEQIGISLGTHDSSIDYRLKINGIKKRTISQSNTGKPKSLLHRKSLSQSRILSGIARGNKNPNWKGGVQDNWSELKNSSEYKYWRGQVYIRDQFTCKMCGDDRGGNLHAHHIHRRIDNPELKFQVSNGITLCKNCHQKTMGREGKFIALFEKFANSVKPSSMGSIDMVTPSQTQ